MNSVRLKKAARRPVLGKASYFAIPLALLLVTGTFVFSQESGGRWIYVTSSTAGIKFYLDSTYKELDYGIKSIWQKQVKIDGTQDLILSENDCARGKRRLTEYLSYDKEGNVLQSDSLPSSEIWVTPAPDTVDESLLTKICKTRSSPTPPPVTPGHNSTETKRQIREPEDIGVDHAIVTAIRANLRERPDITSATIREIPKGDLLVLLNPYPSGSWYNVIHVGSNQEGWIHSNTVSVKYTKNRKPDLVISGRDTGSLGNPVLEIKNDTEKTMTLKLGDGRYVFSPHESKNIHLSPARYRFHASAPNVIPDFGDQVFELGHIYNWRFYIVTVGR